MKRNVLLTFRRIKNKPTFFLINFLGLTVAFCCVLFVYAYTYQQWHYDGFHTKADRTYRLTMDMNQGESSMNDARMYAGYLDYIREQFPQFEKVTLITNFGKAIVKLESGETFYSEKVIGADSCFTGVFDFPVLAGKSHLLFQNSDELAVTRSTALKYFGSLDVIGKQVKIQHSKETDFRTYTIAAIMEDFPENSHIKAEWICSPPRLRDRSSWFYSYVVLPQGTLPQLIESKLDSLFKDESHNPLFNLQPIRDIHLQSHKTRELKAGGNENALILLLFGALIIYLMALANFFNLNYVQLIKNQANHSIKKLHGANGSDVASEEVTEKILLIVLAVGFAVFIFIGAFKQFHLNFIQSQLWLNYTLVLTGLSVFALLFAVVPVLRFYRRLNLGAIRPVRAFSFRFFFVTQFVLSILVLSSVLIMKKQIGFINKMHPGATSSNVIVIPHVPGNMSLRYDLFKEKLLRHPEIIDITSAMEEPAGTITDNFYFKMEGVDNSENRTLNILCTDSNFFSFFGIHAIAGNINLGAIASQEWEKNVLDLNDATKQKNSDEINRLTPLVSGYHEKYILNKAALDFLGIADPNTVIGKRFEIDFQIPYLFPAGEVVAVVNDFHYTNLFNKEKPLMIVTRKIFSRNYICRIDTANMAKALAAINDEWKSITPDTPFEYEFLSDSYRLVYSNEYAQSRIISLFALIAVIISILGMYALITFQMEKQTKEIGVRKVIGAKVSEIMWMYNHEIIKWVGLAFIIAAPLAYITMYRWLQNFAYKTELSWWIFALAGFIALAVALFTISWQSWKAATRNPVEALRYE